MSISDCLIRAVINTSSAYAIHCLSRVEILPLRSSFFSTVLITRLNKVGESRSPCFTLLYTLNCHVYALFTFTFVVVFSRVSLTNLINLGGILFWVKESNILFLLIKSKACV